MVNCPVCGKEVEPTTTYCPACGANIRQDSTILSQSKPSDREFYASSYRGDSPSPTYSAGRPTRPRRTIWAIVAALLIGLFVGAAIGYTLPSTIDYTTVTGIVTINVPRAVPHLAWFNSTTYGNLTSAVQSNRSYIVNLPTGDTYHISIEWYNVTGPIPFGSCKPTPSSFTSNQASQIENLSC